ncbi:MAG: methionyl-tRNA formyltransferase [Cellvibrionaceae bacterium]|nr:methionyl-tRNA formyltransferase [Cellvibrionaceae bacterium]
MNTAKLRIIFAGTPVFAAHHLQALIDSAHQVVAVYTQPDRRAGRGKKLTPSPVKALAMAHQLPIYQPLSLKDEAAQAELAAHHGDIMVVVAYGLLLPKAVLDSPRYGCINVHGSLLPRWRGAAPIQRAIEAGDKRSGITIMQMDEGLDTGDMLLTAACDINPDDTSASLHDKLMSLGAKALVETLSQLPIAQGQAQKQNHAEASYAEKIRKEEALIDWSRPARVIERQVRTYMPVPIAYSFLHDQRIKIHRATVAQTMDKTPSGTIKPGTLLSLGDQALLVACGQQALAIQQLQLPGKKPMTAQQLRHGYAAFFQPGQCFGK